MSKFAAFEKKGIAMPKKCFLVDDNGVPYRSSDGEKKPAYIELYSNDSEIARRHDQSVVNSRLNAAQRRGTKPNAELLYEETTEKLVALTVSWFLAITDLPFNTENARELYTNKDAPWIREQVDAFVAERSNFSAAS